MFDIVMSVIVLAAVALVAGAIAMLRRGNRKQGMLMLLLAAVMVANVAIWLIPTESGDTLADAAASSDD
ncbi:hypothetical protein [Aurantiacibacter sediminis]|uniref:Uncharacterized protein n=1 Tax=Aurantiacibacter sediminis TaxID=2793064 RepID=A0ABS0N5J9_9SPHN|nr:hypothetical protein [Aurantiacibacter sediminis]MBH5323063.1 hypothetical protein [Aurantiacibacter sediminis]